jgi:hypothetical protein
MVNIISITICREIVKMHVSTLQFVFFEEEISEKDKTSTLRSQ